MLKTTYWVKKKIGFTQKGNDLLSYLFICLYVLSSTSLSCKFPLYVEWKRHRAPPLLLFNAYPFG